MNKKIKVIESQIQKEYKKLALIKDEETAKLREHYNNAFGHLVEEDPEIHFESNYEGFNIRKTEEGRDYPTDILTVRYKTSNYDLEFPDQIGLNYYTTSTINDFELKRLALIGSAAKTVLNNQPEILEDFVEVKKTFNSDLVKRQEIIRDLDTERLELEKLQYELDKEEKLKKAFGEGVYLEDSNNSYDKKGQHVVFRGDRSGYNITKIRIIDYVNPETKKSVNIEVTETPQTYNHKTGKYLDLTPNTYKVNKVRLSNIMGYINNSK